MLRSLNARLLALMVVLVGLSLLATTVAALRAANANVRLLVAEELVVRERVARSALAQAGVALTERLSVITADFGFKAAVASNDRETILSALANQGDRLDADMVMLLDERGAIAFSSIETSALPAALRNTTQASVPDTLATLAVMNGRAYRLAASPILAPALMGWLVIGEELGSAALRELEALGDAQISFLLSTGDDIADTRLLTTITDADIAADADLGTRSFDARTLDARILDKRLQALGYLNREIRLTELGADPRLRAFVSLSIRAALASYDPLRFQLVAIALIALLAAIVLSSLAARWLTRPISAMVNTAQKIADGDYSHRPAIHSGTELDTLGNALRFMQDTVAEREARIQHQAQHDLLTQLPNRNYLFSLYQRFLREHPQRAKFGLALLELENLQQLRDLYGASFSDEVLRESAQRVARSLRRGDMAGRVGDQQILLFLQGVDQTGLDAVLDKIAEQSGADLVIEGVPVQPDLRMGFAFSPAQGTEFDDLQRRAQLALTQARKDGLSHATYRVGQDEKHLRQIRIANRLQEAISAGAFTLLYQPKYSLRENQLSGAEALIRWTDSELGQVFPDEFIAIAEQTGLITQLSKWVVDQVIAVRKDLDTLGVALSISINLSGIDVLQADFIDDIVARIDQENLAPDALVLEVTETAMMADADAARDNLLRAADRGIRVSIDDYGTGFSSLAQLRSLPVKELKLDKSLVETIDREAGDRLIVQSTIDMAHHLELDVVAEGVETVEILEELIALGCDTLQGYLLARPLPLQELKTLATQGSEAMTLIRDTLKKHAHA